jgi:RHS repeat-associated protein
MRNVNTWQPYAQGSQLTPKFGRGYTGHEHLNDFGLINMNARLYDPVLGRFLAPDALVSSVYSNDFNRYIYAGNNPLMYVDLNGEYPGPPVTDVGGVTYINGGNNVTGGNNYLGYGGNNYSGVGSDNWSSFNYGGNSGNGSYQYSAYYGGNFGGSIPDGALSGVPGLVLYGIDILFNHKPDPRYLPQNVTYGAAQVKGVNAKPVNLPKPVGTGASMVYASGGGSLRNHYSDNTQEYKFPYQFFEGLSLSAASEMFYSETFKTWMGKDFKFRTTIGREGNGNQHVGGKYKFGKRISNIFKWINWGITIYNFGDNTSQYVNDEINGYQYLTEQGSNLASNIPLYGSAWSVGWEAGRLITYSSYYQQATFRFWYNQGINSWGAPNEINHVVWDEWLDYYYKYHHKSF